MTTITGVSAAARRDGASRDPQRNRQRVHVALHITLIAWAIIAIFPAFYMVLASFQTTQQIYKGVQLLPQHATFSNYLQAWEEASFGRYFANSVFYTATVTATVLLLGTAGAYAFARLRFFGKNFIFYAVLAFLFIPIPGQFIPLYVILVRLHLANTSIGYILPLINANLPATIFILRRFFEAMPREIDEAARVDGASRFRVYRSIALPLAKPAIATVAILTVLGVWNEFVLALVVFSDQKLMPLQVGLQTFQGTYFSEYGQMMAALTIATIPVVAVYLAFQRFIIQGVMAGAVKG
ncbi:MAG TPA: carbohydrate ABC transporter permease [Propionicimonas sp.]|jgi:multiple sugar transport system permease protein/raffinose/stachyose/melibiose transport system permease protein